MPPQWEDSEDSGFDGESPATKRRKLGSKNDSDTSRRHSGHLSQQVSVVVQPNESKYPRSQVRGPDDTSKVFSERDALERILRLWRERTDDCEEQYPDIELADFTVYRKVSQSTKLGNLSTLEMVELYRLQTDMRCDDFVIDGLLKYENHEFLVKGMPFSTLSVGGYDIREASTISWVQTSHAANHRCWYHLFKPSTQYHSYFEAYEWLANLAKYFIDFINEHPQAGLHSFRSEFNVWLCNRYPHRDALELRLWRNKHPRQDYRVTIIRYMLYKETIGGARSLHCHRIWNELLPEALNAIPIEPQTETSTVVTPFVFSCFQSMYFADVLLRLPLASSVQTVHTARMSRLGFTLPLDEPPKTPKIPRATIENIRPGCIIIIARDVESAWTDDCNVWFAYVQCVIPAKDPVLNVVWLYDSKQTLCGNMHYPHKNELFWSDHCNCGERSLRASQVAGVVHVEWLPKRIPKQKYFIRQMYDDDSFTTFNISRKCCSHILEQRRLKTIRSTWREGETVLIEERGTLRPFVVMKTDEHQLQARRLLRRHEYDKDQHVRLNELLWSTDSNDVCCFKLTDIRRQCHVQIFAPMKAHQVPPIPYDRAGQGDCFIITGIYDGHRVQKLTTHTKLPLILGADFTSLSKPALRSLSLFSGGGLFDRGLEEGGSIRTTHVVEYSSLAIHTFAANVAPHRSISFFNGSVDDHLKAAIEGRYSHNVPSIDQIDHMSGGSPCQGYSLMQAFIYSASSCINASRVASIAAYVDLYRPLYGLFENVLSMSCSRGPNKDQNAFQQLICAFVSMGYQVRVFNLDAWSFGSAQSRSRLFISITAPGLSPVLEPQSSHAHPSRVKSSSLGKSANGRHFGQRKMQPTPFPAVSAEEAFKDLPGQSLGAPQSFSHPDHRSLRLNISAQRIINSLPTQGFLSNPVNIVRTIEAGFASASAVRDWSQQHPHRQDIKSSSYARISPTGLVSTVTTGASLSCCRSGRWVHWAQNRPLTLLEVRRAQGFLDHEPILGRIKDQWKIVGNSVARSVALAIGIETRKAWESCHSLAAPELQVGVVPGNDVKDTAVVLQSAPIANTGKLQILRQEEILEETVIITKTLRKRIVHDIQHVGEALPEGDVATSDTRYASTSTRIGHLAENTEIDDTMNNELERTVTTIQTKQVVERVRNHGQRVNSPRKQSVIELLMEQFAKDKEEELETLKH